MMLKRIYIAVLLFAKQTQKQCKTGKPQCNICLPVNGGGFRKEEPLNFAIFFCDPLVLKSKKKYLRLSYSTDGSFQKEARQRDA